MTSPQEQDPLDGRTQQHSGPPKLLCLFYTYVAIVPLCYAQGWCEQYSIKLQKGISASSSSASSCVIEATTSRIVCMNTGNKDSNIPEGAWLAVAVGQDYGSHKCAIHADTLELHCWGSGIDGRTAPPADVKQWEYIATGLYHNCGIEFRTGRMRCFGLESGDRHNYPAGVGNWSFVSAGILHTCGIDKNRRMHCWGGQITDASLGVPQDVEYWTTAHVQYDHGCGIADRTMNLHCWGDGNNGGSSITTIASRWKDASVSRSGICAITTNGTLHCSGGQHFPNDGHTPPGHVWSAVATTQYSPCGIIEHTEEVKCWIDPDAIFPTRNQDQVPTPGLRALAYPILCKPPVFDPSVVSPDANATHLNLIDSTGVLDWTASAGMVLDGWTNLRRVAMPASLATLSTGALLGAPRLGAVDLSRCSNLTALSPHSIGTSTGSLVVLDLPDSIADIESEAFLAPDGTVNEGLEAFSIPTGLTTLHQRSLVGIPLENILDFSGTQLQTLHTGALDGHEALEEVLFPRTLRNISSGAFRALSQVESLRLGGTQVQDLCSGSLQGLSSLEKIELPVGLRFLQANTFDSSPLLSDLNMSHTRVTKLPSLSLSGLTGLSTIHLPASLESVEAFAFPAAPGVHTLDLSHTHIKVLAANGLHGLSGLHSVLLPPRLQQIEAGAFNGSALATLDLRATNLTALQAGCFDGLSVVSAIHLPSSINRIEARAFIGVSIMPNLDLQSTMITHLEKGALDGLSAVSEVFFPDSLEIIDRGAMVGAPKLERIDFSRTQVPVLRTGVFAGLHEVERVYLPSSLREIENGAFPNGSIIEQLDLTGTGLTMLRAGSLAGLTNLSEIDLPGGLLEIEPRSFPNTQAMLSIDLSKTSIEVLKSYALAGLSGLGPAPMESPVGPKLSLQQQIKLPATLASIEEGAFPVAPGASGLLDLSHTALVELKTGALDGMSGLREIRLPPALRYLRGGALRGASSLENLDLAVTQIDILEAGAMTSQSTTGTTFPSSLVSIEKGAFNESRGSVSLQLQGANITTLRQGAFLGLEVESILLPSSLNDIKAGAFDGLNGVSNLNLQNTNVTVLRQGSLDGLVDMSSIELPTILDEIEGGAFRETTSLTSVDISATQVTTLRSGALSGTVQGDMFLMPSTLRVVESGFMSGLEGGTQDLSNTQIEHFPVGLFDGVRLLSGVIPPHTLRVINSGAFRGCTGITELNLKHTRVERLRTGALAGMPLTALGLPSSLSAIESGALPVSDELAILDLRETNVKTLVSGALEGVSRLGRGVATGEGLLLPANLSSIEAGAFVSQLDLLSLDMSNTSLVILKANAFTGLGKLKSLLLPPTVATVQPGAFEGCGQVLQVSLRDAKVTHFAPGALDGLYKATNVEFPSLLQVLEPGALRHLGSLKAVNLGNTVLTELFDGALEGASSSVSIQLPPSLAHVHPGAFNDSGSTPVLDLSATAVTELAEGSLSGLKGLSQLKLPQEISVLRSGALRGVIPDSSLAIIAPGLISIEVGAFLGMQIPRQLLRIEAPALEVLPRAVFATVSGTQALEIVASGDLQAGDDTVCSLFEGLSGLQSLRVEAAGAQNLFGQERALMGDGFRSCSFASSLQQLRLYGLDLSNEALTMQSFAGLPGLRALVLVGSGHDRSFAIAGDFLTPLPQLVSVDLSGNGVETLPLLSRSSGGSLQSIHLNSNPLDVVVENPFANLFKLEEVVVDLDKTCAAGTVRQPVTVLNGDDPAMCVMCPRGHFCSSGLVAEECPQGTYNPSQAVVDSSGCLDCRPGSTTSNTAAVSESQCTAVPLDCPPGTAGPLCDLCGPGTFSLGGDVDECAVCQPGTVSRRPTASVRCDECPRGTYMPVAGGAETSSCVPCGDGLRSDSGSSTCSGCTAGLLLSEASKVCKAPTGECDREDMVCLPGVPQPVAAPLVMIGLLDSFPLPQNGPAADYAGAPASRRLQTDRALQPPLEASLLRHPRVGTRDANKVQPPPPAMCEDESHDQYRPRHLQTNEDHASEESDRAPDLQSTDDIEVNLARVETLAWIISSVVVASLTLFLLVPAVRLPMQCCLKRIDTMSADHSPEQFAAIRKISTASGGWFSVAAFLVALAASSSLVLEYAYQNQMTINGLQVAAKGVPGADRAAEATAAVVLDIALQPAAFVPCEEALVLQVSSGGRVTSSADGSGINRVAEAGTLVQLAASGSVKQLDAEDSNQPPICWLRATCDDCGLPEVVEIEAVAHWSVQVMAWRMAATDASGLWASASGVTSPPSADISSGNSTSGLDQMLDTREETISFVGHNLDDETGSDSSYSSGYRVQDMRLGLSTARSAGVIDPSVSSTTLRLHVNRSPVFASTRIASVYTLPQVVSSIVGLTVGILGGFKAAFALFEKVFGDSLEWLCGPSGRVLTEEEAMSRRRETLVGMGGKLGVSTGPSRSAADGAAWDGKGVKSPRSAGGISSRGTTQAARLTAGSRDQLIAQAKGSRSPQFASGPTLTNPLRLAMSADRRRHG